jgi:hypothetical protein
VVLILSSLRSKFLYSNAGLALEGNDPRDPTHAAFGDNEPVEKNSLRKTSTTGAFLLKNTYTTQQLLVPMRRSPMRDLSLLQDPRASRAS